ncbi:MAG TPA: ABC transporter substrate-binding protein [Dehalococcoidia bacterium]|nr:ABC transporter substrate-binding protein [Dehalococcoidia bacterium]
MKVKKAFASFTFLIAVLLLLLSCGSNTATSDSTSEGFSEKPEYGGTLNFVYPFDVGIYDPVSQGQMMGPVGMLVLEQLLGEDWTKGPAGSGEVAWVMNVTPAPDTSMGVPAESWEIPELGTINFKVRQDVQWALNPESEASRLMNGREFTADDLIDSFNYMMQYPNSPIQFWAPILAGTATMKMTGPWEVTLKTPTDPLGGWNWFVCSGSWFYLFPPEVIEKYGGMEEWQNVVGTGPFMLTNSVTGSSATLKKNPDYWGIDPIGPGKGNQLPYVDDIKFLVIPDTSTSDAVFRTGKADMTVTAAETANNFIQNTPELQHRSYLQGNSGVIMMRTDKTSLPYGDKRVRQAMMLAINYSALKDDLYGGEAEILTFPVTSENKQVYIPLEDMPGEVQTLFSHNTDKARELLTDAGYSEGFTASIIVPNIFGIPDFASLIKSMWHEVGIDLEIQPQEFSVYNSMVYARSYDEIMLVYLPVGSVAYPSCLSLSYFRGESIGYVNDPVIDSVFQEIKKNVIINMPEANRLYRDLLPHIVEQVHYLPLPSVYTYSLWWPWLKNYYGEIPWRLFMYSWIDQDLKEEILEGE